MTPSVSIDEQIREVERELALRRGVYAKRVGQGKMRKGEADYFMERMQAVLTTLQWVRDRRDTIIKQVKESEGDK